MEVYKCYEIERFVCGSIFFARILQITLIDSVQMF